MYCEKCGKYSGKYPLCKECYYDEIESEEELDDEENIEEDELICPICGEPTYIYFGNPRNDRLCAKHGKMFKNGWIELNDNNEYQTTEDFFKKSGGKSAIPKYEKDSNTKNTKEINNEESTLSNNIIVINDSNKSKCITCGKKTDGLLFCADCYKKYSNKELLFKITACSSVELLDADYEGRYTCKDGHIVKSKSEREIDNFLFANDIPHAYEKKLPYGKSDKEVLHPDFYLPNYLGKDKHVWLEHWGYNENNIQYTKTKKFKMPIYEKLGITLICTYEKSDAGDIDAALERKLNKLNINEGEINYKD